MITCAAPEFAQREHFAAAHTAVLLTAPLRLDALVTGSHANHGFRRCGDADWYSYAKRTV